VTGVVTGLVDGLSVAVVGVSEIVAPLLSPLPLVALPPLLLI
jgi:hypothetical protein